MKEASQQKLDYTFSTAKRLLRNSEILQPHQEIVGALLMLGVIPEPMPTEITKIKNILVEQGFM